VVQSGDRMTTIAERFCGDASEAQTIADFNGLADPSLIRPGQELRIPEDCGA
jgi:nucleoid-associated protein YgaU